MPFYIAKFYTNIKVALARRVDELSQESKQLKQALSEAEDQVAAMRDVRDALARELENVNVALETERVKASAAAGRGGAYRNGGGGDDHASANGDGDGGGGGSGGGGSAGESVIVV